MLHLGSRWHGDRGSGALEAVMATVVFFTFLGLVVVVGRLNLANAEVESAARTAARTISMARDPYAAIPRARDDAADTVGVASGRCRNWRFTPTITAETVTVTIHCDVDVEQPLLVDLPGSMPVNETATEVLDQYRSES